MPYASQSITALPAARINLKLQAASSLKKREPRHVDYGAEICLDEAADIPAIQLFHASPEGFRAVVELPGLAFSSCADEMDVSYPVIEAREGPIGRPHEARDIIHFQTSPELDPIALQGRGFAAAIYAPWPGKGQGRVGRKTQGKEAAVEGSLDEGKGPIRPIRRTGKWTRLVFRYWTARIRTKRRRSLSAPPVGLALLPGR
jgi:hypothetical protein